MDRGEREREREREREKEREREGGRERRRAGLKKNKRVVGWRQDWKVGK